MADPGPVTPFRGPTSPDAPATVSLPTSPLEGAAADPLGALLKAQETQPNARKAATCCGPWKA